MFKLLFCFNLISVQPYRSTHSSDVVTLSRPPSSSSLTVNNRSFHHASPCLWNQLPKELRLPADHEDLSLLSDLTHISLSIPSSPLSPSITPLLFHSRQGWKILIFFKYQNIENIEKKDFFNIFDIYRAFAHTLLKYKI